MLDYKDIVALVLIGVASVVLLTVAVFAFTLGRFM